ncbi:hypothetical protein PTKIN_Ptkin12aG0022000 [Pterospermum kingtungense]
MENNGKRSGHQCLAILVMAMTFFLNYDQASAFSTTTRNSSGSQCSGSMQECLIVNDANVVFFADPETSLATQPLKYVTDRAKKKGYVITDCGKGKPCHPCVPDPNHPKKGDNYRGQGVYQDKNKNRGR